MEINSFFNLKIIDNVERTWYTQNVRKIPELKFQYTNVNMK